MQIPLSWINEFVPLDKSPREIEDAFNQLGIEVEGVHQPGADLVGVRIARIVEVHPHPDADRLRLADIDFGEAETRRVVCGAPRLEPGMVVGYAASGVTLPNGMKLEKRKIRGVVSDGMLCSAPELGINGDQESGLYEFPSNTTPGADAGEVLGSQDVVFEFSITPNRPDAMCVIGLARELSAHFGIEMTEPAHKPLPDLVDNGLPEVVVSNSQRCPRYTAWRAEVAVSPSPKWLVERLGACGLRSVNNVVDVTNYVMLEMNQPLHAFDADVVRSIHVRDARDGEEIVTLDGKKRTLNKDDLLICDADDKAQALAGVMGGEHSEISDATTRILLESAYFSPAGVGFTSRRLGLRTEASARYERGLDPNSPLRGAARAMELLVEVANAKVEAHVSDTHPDVFPSVTIEVRPERVNALLGTKIDPQKMASLLTSLGFEVVVGQPAMSVVVPTFRPDVTREIDVVEEVARGYGYQNISSTLTTRSFHRGSLTRAQRDRRVMSQVLLGAGFNEAKCFPLVAPQEAEMFGVLPSNRIVLANPLRDDESVVTSTLLPGLLKSVRSNMARGIKHVELFEIDRVFEESNEELPSEAVTLAGVACGTRDERPLGSERPHDAYSAAAVVRQLVEALAIEDFELVPAMVLGFDPKTSHAIMIDGSAVGAVGLIEKQVASHFGINEPVAAFEIPTDALTNAKRKLRTHVAPSVQPPTYFDLAFLVDNNVAAEQLLNAVRSADVERIESARVFDVFEGAHVPAGKKSVAIAVVARDATATLNDKQIQLVRKACIKAVEKNLGGELRG